MGQLEQFFVNHWALWLAFFIILALIFINELQTQKKKAKELSPAAAVDLINHEDAAVIDLRDAELFRTGHILDSIRASEDDFSQNRMDKYKKKPIILVCARGLQSAKLAAKLRNEGFLKSHVLAGGIAAWQAAELPIVKGK
jgi:rhodanese-related sulfurtransferase